MRTNQELYELSKPQLITTIMKINQLRSFRYTQRMDDSKGTHQIDGKEEVKRQIKTKIERQSGKEFTAI